MKNDQSTMLRWPDGLRRAVVEAAARNRRSMNSEILARLESSFGGLDLTHGNLMPCACGAGAPDVTWHSNGRVEAHHVQCPCGRGVTDATEDGAAIRWNGMIRAALAGRVA